jgi:hypothetical protein
LVAPQLRTQGILSQRTIPCQMVHELMDQPQLGVRGLKFLCAVGGGVSLHAPAVIEKALDALQCVTVQQQRRPSKDVAEGVNLIE